LSMNASPGTPFARVRHCHHPPFSVRVKKLWWDMVRFRHRTARQQQQAVGQPPPQHRLEAEAAAAYTACVQALEVTTQPSGAFRGVR
jgi:hypothetical protein